MVIERGAPQRLPKERGIFRNWGAFFDFNDVLEIPHGGLSFPHREWSISVWITLPITYETGRKHILVQSIEGTRAHLAVDETCSRLGSFDEDRDLFIDSGADLNKYVHKLLILCRYKKGWHNIIVTCENSVEMKVTFFIDGNQTKES